MDDITEEVNKILENKAQLTHKGCAPAIVFLIIILCIIIYFTVDNVVSYLIMLLIIIIGGAYVLYYDNVAKREEEEIEEQQRKEKLEQEELERKYEEYHNRAEKISETQFNLLKKTANNLYDFTVDVCKRKDVKKWIDKTIKLEKEDGSPWNIERKIPFIMVADIYRAFLGLGHDYAINYKEDIGLFLFVVKIVNPNFIIDYEDLTYYKVMTQSEVEGLLDMAVSLAKNNVFDSNKFCIQQALNICDIDLAVHFMTLLYRFISAIAKSDGNVTEEEEKWLSELVKSQSNMEIYTVENRKKTEIPEKKKYKDPIKELDSLIGLENVKEEVKKLMSYIKIQQMRKEKGLGTINISYHIVFTGNPGTGKTTVARIICEIYKNLGVVNRGQLIEVDRAGLVAEYVGQTAIKTNNVIDSALDGVLFIDEAYSLANKGNNDYGNEAISTLLKRMEDDRDRLVVILAGYSNEMKQFIDSNPGLQSRFNKNIQFDDYNEDELMKIFMLNLKKHEYKINEPAKDKVYSLFKNVVINKDKNFGNARFVRNVFEKTIENQSLRLTSLSNISIDALSLIILEDIPDC